MTGALKRAAREARDVSTGVVILAFDHEILDLALDLMAAGTIRGRDAVHAATTAAYGITKIISVDRGFDAVPGLERVDDAGSRVREAHSRHFEGLVSSVACAQHLCKINEC